MEFPERNPKGIFWFDKLEDLNFRSILSKISIEDILWERERRRVHKVKVKHNDNIPVKRIFKTRNLNLGGREQDTYEVFVQDVLITAPDFELDYQIQNIKDREIIVLEEQLKKLVDLKEKYERELEIANTLLKNVIPKIKDTQIKLNNLRER